MQLLHCMTLVSFSLFFKHLGNLQELFGQMVNRPVRQKIARTPILWSNTACSNLHVMFNGIPLFIFIVLL